MVMEEQTLAELDAAQLRELTQRLLGELRHQAALLDNYEHTSEEGKKIIEGAAFAAAQPAAPVKGSAKRVA